MRVIPCEQGTAQWLEIRRGRITASRIVDVLNQLKRGGEGADRRNYRIELISERLSGRSEPHYVSPEMDWGSECEPFARAAYEIAQEVIVDTAGFVMHPTYDFAGSSPDGLVGEDGLIEIKCPKTTTHTKWLMAGEVPEEHQAQMLWNMVCCERQWCDFISFDPRMPDGLKIFIVRMERDDSRILDIESEVQRFQDEVEHYASDLRKKVTVAPPKAPPVVDDRSPYEQAAALFEGEIIP
jgi:putative phage-type endonuclease